MKSMLNLLNESYNAELKSTILNCYNRANKNKKLFLKLLKKETGVTKLGLNQEPFKGYLETLVFKDEN